MNTENLATVTETRSLGELFTELTSETGTLIRQEIRLARIEFTDSIAQFKACLVKARVAVVFGLCGVSSLLAAVIFLVSYVITLWASALLVGVLAMAGAFYLASAASEGLRSTEFVPRETVEKIREDATWLKNQI